MKITLGNTLPPYPDFVEGIRRTHDRGYTLVPVQAKLSLVVTSTTCRLPFPMIFYKVMDNLEPILAIELMNAAQGVDFRRPLKTSPLLEHFLHTCRKEVPFVKDDIVMYKEIHKTVAFLKRTKFAFVFITIEQPKLIRNIRV